MGFHSFAVPFSRGRGSPGVWVAGGPRRGAGGCVRDARAAGAPPRVPDAHRIAALEAAQVGLRVLHGSRGPRRRAPRRQGAGGAEKARLAVSRARLLSTGGAMSHSGGERYRIRPGGGVGGTLTVPGDKSISHRALMLGALAEGDTHISGFLAGEDCLATVRALRSEERRVGKECRSRWSPYH